MTHPYIVDTTPDENGVVYSNVQNKKDKQNDYCDDEIVPHTQSSKQRKKLKGTGVVFLLCFFGCIVKNNLFFLTY